MLVISANQNSTDLYDYIMRLSAFDVSKHIPQCPIQNSIEQERKPKKQNVRNELLNQLYQLYLTQANKELLIKNKKRYYAYIRLHHPGALTKKENYNKYKDVFRKAKLPDEKKYLIPLKESDYMWYKRFNKSTKAELREMISVAKDMIHRKNNVIGYILKEDKLLA